MDEYSHPRQPVGDRVFRYTDAYLFRHRRSHRLRFVTPTLVRVLVDVAVVTSQVAAAVYLQDELVDE